MLTCRAAVLLVCLAPAVGLLGCASDDGGSEDAAGEQRPVAYKLAVIENRGPDPDPALVRRFRRQLDALAGRCRNPRIRLADMSITAQRQLEERGVEESLLSILTHVNDSIPRGIGRLNCVDVFGAYVILRTG